MSKSNKGSRKGGSKKGSRRKPAKRKPAKRKNPNRRKGGQRAWATRRKKYGPTGMPPKRRRKGASKGGKKAAKKPAKKQNKRSGAAKRKVSPASIAALKRYNEGRRKGGGPVSTLQGGGSPYMQRMRRIFDANIAFSPEAQKARDEAAEMARFS